MKKLFLLILPFLFISSVKADTIIIPSYATLNDYNTNFNSTLLNNLLNTYTNYSSTYPYYIINYNAMDNYSFTLYGNSSSTDMYYSSSENYTGLYICGDKLIISYENNNITVSQENSVSCYVINTISYNDNGFTSSVFDYQYYDSNINFTLDLNDFSFDEINITQLYSDTISLINGQSIPKLKDLLQYSSWSDYYQNNLTGYTEVNLNNYEYVILSLKNYSQTNAFQTNLQLKGQIGITPVYNYGQTSKDAITGSQVQDRCNLSYSNYTSYPFYILQSDLQNNAVYYIKSCENNSSFKFDSTIFDITYITQSNLNDPTITISGNTYHTIPYADLPSSATENEENNYIPGQSGSATDTGGLDSAIKSAQNNLSIIWNTITYFTDFVGLLFSALPVELRTILISAFVVCITLGIIKLFVGH